MFRSVFPRSKTNSGCQVLFYFRDAAGQVEKVLLPSNRWDELKYDMLGRVSEVQHFDGTSERYEYALDGALVGAVNDDVEVRFETDALGRVVREHVGDVEVRSQYGANGARELVESSLGARQASLYDELGEVESLHHGPIDAFWRAQVSIGRDDLGAEVGRALPNGIELSWELDAASRPTARHTTRQQPGARAIELDARRYQWRGDDQIAAIIDAVRGPRWFDHDGRGRLIRERRPGTSPLAGDAAIDRAMDAVGNVYRTPNLSDRQYGLGGRIEQAGGTKYEHDELGNLTRKTEPNGATWRYRWNGAGMLTEVERPDGSRVGFEYDVFARRTKKTLYTVDESNIEGPKDPKVRAMMDLPPAEPARIVEREVRFVWDGDHVIHELSSDDGLTTWYWQPGSFTPVAKERTGQFWHLTHDHLGTPTEMYNEAGELVWQMSLDIFGEPSFDIGTAQDCPWRWPGQFEDEETGLFYNRWRYLERSAGSYVSKDPIGLLGGLRPFAYVNDPSLFVDVFGLNYIYAMINSAGNVYYVGRASTNASEQSVMYRHSRNVGWDGPRFVEGADRLLRLTDTDINANAVRGLEEMGIRQLSQEGVIGRTRRSDMGGRPRRRANNDPGVSARNAKRTRYLRAARRFLQDEGLESVQELYERARNSGGSCA